MNPECSHKTFSERFGFIAYKSRKTGISYKTALVIQALKTLGSGKVDDKVVTKLSKGLSDDEKRALLMESQYATSWIFETVKRIIKVGDTNA